MIHSNSNLRLKTLGTTRPESGVLRTDLEIEGIREAGQVVHAALQAARAACVPGATTADVNHAASCVILNSGADPLFLDQTSDAGEFPAETCVSVEDEVVHGVPGSRVLRSGEIVSIDCGVRLDGWCADSAITVPVGEVDSERLELLAANEAILSHAIEMIRPGRRWSEIASTLQEMTFTLGYGTVEEFSGHGIGVLLHEMPAVPCVMTQGLMGRGDFTLRPGMTLAIEPILVMEPPALRGDGTAVGVPVLTDEDGWTTRTLMGQVTSHFEHTVVVGRREAEVLTSPVDTHFAVGNTPLGLVEAHTGGES
jgi:methionyl aminopeptidase